MTTIDILIDSAVILFLNVIDEYMFHIVTRIAPDWENMIEAGIFKAGPTIRNELDELKNEVKKLRNLIFQEETAQDIKDSLIHKADVKDLLSSMIQDAVIELKAGWTFTQRFSPIVW